MINRTAGSNKKFAILIFAAALLATAPGFCGFHAQAAESYKSIRGPGTRVFIPRVDYDLLVEKKILITDQNGSTVANPGHVDSILSMINRVTPSRINSPRPENLILRVLEPVWSLGVVVMQYHLSYHEPVEVRYMEDLHGIGCDADDDGIWRFTLQIPLPTARTLQEQLKAKNQEGSALETLRALAQGTRAQFGHSSPENLPDSSALEALRMGD